MSLSQPSTKRVNHSHMQLNLQWATKEFLLATRQQRVVGSLMIVMVKLWDCGVVYLVEFS